MSLVGFGNWIRRLFSSTSVDDEAAKREEYAGTPDRGQIGLDRERLGSFAGSEVAQAGEDELEEFKPPRDQAP
jgi:hypothetical protein